MSQEYQWFVKPLNVTANEHIAFLLSAELRGDDYCFDVLDDQGNRHRVWRVEHRDVELLEKSRQELDLKFRVFVRQSRHGKLREWKFPKKKTVRR
jgi:hypothetical protein